MNIAQLLSPECIKVASGFSSKKRLFQELGEIAAQAYGIDAGEAVNALLEREALGPTGVGHGVALPHARIDGLDGVVGAFVRLERPLDFDSVDRMPVDLVFALFAPTDAGVAHLKSLALVSRTMRDSTVCSKLRSNDDPATLFAVLTEAVAPQAA